METSSPMIRVTKSQTSVKSQKIKKGDSIPRSALLDITNDSPIVGLAMGSLSEKTPSSSSVKNRVLAMKNAPGSGEDLLRGQVKTVLQKVEKEVEFVIAPTLVNIPQVQIFEEIGTENAPVQFFSIYLISWELIHQPRFAKSFPFDQIAEAVKPEEETLNPQDCPINRALLFDSPDKSEITDNTSTVSSSLTYQGSETEKSPEFDSSSAWSLQVNVSVQDEDEGVDEIEELEEEEEFEEYEEEESEEDYEDESFEELCEGLSKMSVHTRFVYNSDDEIEAGVIVDKKDVSPSVVVLKGLPVLEGKHLRFQDGEDQE